MDILINSSIVLLFVLLNGFFVASEFSLVSVRKTRIAELVKKGNKNAELIQKAQSHMDQYISGTQLGITLASLALGWVGEPFIAHIVEGIFATILSDRIALVSSHTLAFILAFSLISYLHLILGEIAPKSIGLERAEKTAMFVIRPLVIFCTVFSPVITFLSVSGRFIQRIFGLSAPRTKHSTHSEEEIKMLMQQSVESGVIEKGEVEMVKRVFQLGDLRVKKIMIPRRQIQAFSVNKTLIDLEDTLDSHEHSRFPIYKNSLHTILGFVHIKDFYRALNIKNANKKIGDLSIIRSILFVRDTDRADDVLLLMRKKRVHIAIVRSKKNKTVGLITLEDIMESLVGEIEDEFE